MLLNIITGGQGCGKSHYLYRLIRENLKNNPNANAIVLVPEQYSYTTEKTLSGEIGGLGLNQIEVLTFSRLVSRYVRSNNNIKASGKIMLICKAMSELSEENIFFAGTEKVGFADCVCELFSEFKRYKIAPQDLADITPENETSQKKLASLYEIYKNYTELFKDDFTDQEDALTVFADMITEDGLFENTFFFIDDYSDFMPQHISVIEALIKVSRGVHITLSMGNSDEDGLFAPVLKTYKKLEATALSLGAQLYTKTLSKQAEYIDAPDIRHLIKNWETGEAYKEPCENISVFTARDIYSEAEHTASQIVSLVRDKGLRFRDIGIICGDINTYLHILTSVFADYNIPFFTDEKLSCSMHPVARTVLSLFDITEHDWSYASVFSYLRAGFVYVKDETQVYPLPQEDIDLLDNYVTAHAIHGKKSWFSEWTDRGETAFDDVIENRHIKEYDLEKLNELRKLIIGPFAKFLENKGRTVRKIAESVFNFICDINLYEGIQKECDDFDVLGLRDESEQCRQVWNCIIEVLDQMVITLGKGSLSRERFAFYFKCGLSKCELSIIPSGLDRVRVGTVSRNSPVRVKSLFILGAVQGAIPCNPSSESLLGDLDRNTIGKELEKKGKELAPDNSGRMALENLKLYKAVSTATSKLYISYPASDTDGHALLYSSFVTTLVNMFGDLKKSDNILLQPTYDELLSSQKRGFYNMLLKLSEYYKQTPDRLWESVYLWYSKNDEYKDKLEILKTAASYKRMQPSLSREKAELLYGKNKKYSITALEQYSRCPFAYYMERGLYAMPQEEKRLESSHIGSLIHAAICEYCRIVEEGAETTAEIHALWEKLTPEKTEEIIHNVMDKMREKILSRAGNETNRIEYLLSRCERTLRKSADTIQKSISLGGYTCVCREKSFEVKIKYGNENVTLIGTIDRIDVLEKPGENKVNIRIIDYKSGHKEFSIQGICNKLDMQLVLYAVAAVNMCKDGILDKTDCSLKPQITAILYNRFNDDFVKVEKNTAEIAEKELNKQKRLDGLVVLDEDENEGLIEDGIYEMDKNYDGDSELLHISQNKDGKFTSASQITSRKTFDAICHYMQKAVIETDKSVKSGKISINPYRDANRTSCDFCKYKEACMFDANFDKYRFAITDKEKALEHITKEADD